ncbi:MAG TPA: hydroxyacid-oxoacid transhydrogenase [Casimicrobiaceae bacterium]|nr:hydroxyacid-oxoacid transhydrogenase [Casimicrobiaceae bacterium]
MLESFMRCCHADFTLDEGSDRGFTLGMPTFTFGSGVLDEAGNQARELGLARVALFTDRTLSSSEHVAKVRASLGKADVEVVMFDEVEVEPTDRSFQSAARFASEGRFDGFVSVGGGSVIDTCKAANLYASHPAEFMTYVNAPLGGGQRVPGPLKPHIACPTTAGTGSETTGIAIFTLGSLNAKTGIISRRLIPTIALVDPDVTRTLPSNVVAATGFDCMSHALEAITARAWPRRLNPARGVARPVSQGANPFSDLLGTQALRLVGEFHERAVRDANDTEARTEMMYAAMLAGIAFNASGCHLPHGLSYPVSGMTRDWRVAGYPEDKTLVPHGMAVVLNNPSVWRYIAPTNPSRHIHCAQSLGADAKHVAQARDEDAGELLATRVIDLMKATNMPNGLSALGFSEKDLDALATGAEPQYRVIKNGPVDVGREEIKALYRGALRYW